ncbi:MAG: hypothetical protein LC799_04420 [Actinobacteria bacterium]|nr:hypothetical protein [Actinomycetota bacterium]
MRSSFLKWTALQEGLIPRRRRTSPNCAQLHEDVTEANPLRCQPMSGRGDLGLFLPARVMRWIWPVGPSNEGLPQEPSAGIDRSLPGRKVPVDLGRSPRLAEQYPRLSTILVGSSSGARPAARARSVPMSSWLA